MCIFNHGNWYNNNEAAPDFSQEEKERIKNSIEKTMLYSHRTNWLDPKFQEYIFYFKRTLSNESEQFAEAVRKGLAEKYNTDILFKSFWSKTYSVSASQSEMEMLSAVPDASSVNFTYDQETFTNQLKTILIAREISSVKISTKGRFEIEIKEVIWAVKDNKSIENLDLSGLNLGNQRTMTLLKELTKHKTLKNLNLSNNSISDCSLIWVENFFNSEKSSMHSTTVLKSLDISGNNFTNQNKLEEIAKSNPKAYLYY